nr:MAG TPA: hypothetical protein [Caudoviricetes sp.]
MSKACILQGSVRWARPAGAVGLPEFYIYYGAWDD